MRFTKYNFAATMKITKEIDQKILAYVEAGHSATKIFEILQQRYDVKWSSVKKHLARIRADGNWQRRPGKSK